MCASVAARPTDVRTAISAYVVMLHRRPARSRKLVTPRSANRLIACCVACLRVSVPSRGAAVTGDDLPVPVLDGPQDAPMGGGDGLDRLGGEAVNGLRLRGALGHGAAVVVAEYAEFGEGGVPAAFVRVGDDVPYLLVDAPGEGVEQHVGRAAGGATAASLATAHPGASCPMASCLAQSSSRRRSASPYRSAVVAARYST